MVRNLGYLLKLPGEHRLQLKTDFKTEDPGTTIIIAPPVIPNKNNKYRKRDRRHRLKAIQAGKLRPTALN